MADRIGMLSEARRLAESHNGKFHGPNIEHLSISEVDYYGMYADLRRMVIDEVLNLAAAECSLVAAATSAPPERGAAMACGIRIMMLRAHLLEEK